MVTCIRATWTLNSQFLEQQFLSIQRKTAQINNKIHIFHIFLRTLLSFWYTWYIEILRHNKNKQASKNSFPLVYIDEQPNYNNNNKCFQMSSGLFQNKKKKMSSFWFILLKRQVTMVAVIGNTLYFVYNFLEQWARRVCTCAVYWSSIKVIFLKIVTILVMIKII